MQGGFDLFGAWHIAALVATGAASASAALVARRSARAERILRTAIAVFLAGAMLAALAALARDGRLHWLHFLPLQISDLAILLSIVALWTRWRPACELLYFWALTGGLLAMVMPAVDDPMSDPGTALYFALHGLVVVAAVLVTLGSQIYPRRGAPARIWLFTAGYAGVVAVVNLVVGANFLFLRRRPPEPTLLDYFGPWPIYLVVVAAIAAALFWLLGRLTPRADPGT